MAIFTAMAVAAAVGFGAVALKIVAVGVMVKVGIGVGLVGLGLMVAGKITKDPTLQKIGGYMAAVGTGLAVGGSLAHGAGLGIDAQATQGTTETLSATTTPGGSTAKTVAPVNKGGVWKASNPAHDPSTAVANQSGGGTANHLFNAKRDAALQMSNASVPQSAPQSFDVFPHGKGGMTGGTGGTGLQGGAPPETPGFFDQVLDYVGNKWDAVESYAADHPVLTSAATGSLGALGQKYLQGEPQYPEQKIHGGNPNPTDLERRRGLAYYVSTQDRLKEMGAG